MAVSKRSELLERIEELEAENEALQSQIDEIADIVGDGEAKGEEYAGSGLEIGQFIVRKRSAIRAMGDTK